MRFGRYPRVLAIAVVGILLVAGAGLLAIAESSGLLELDRLPIQLGFLGAIITLFGFSGYLSMWVFDTRTE